jgi:hypothetical protein
VRRYAPPGGAQAIPIACGGSASGDTTGGTNQLTWADYGCVDYSKNGPENFYALTVNQGQAVTISVGTTGTPWDVEILLVGENGGACVPNDCLGVSETVADPEVINTFLNPGTYYIVVDGYASEEGAYTIDVACSPCSDVDGDTYGDEACGGTDCDDNDPNINPAEWEICGNVADEDCDGTAQTCPDCQADATLDCVNNSGAGVDTTGGTNSIDDYCGSVAGDYAGNEYIFDLTTAMLQMVVFTTTNSTADFGLFLLPSYAAGYCNPGLCHDAVDSAGGDEELGFWADPSETYYLSVDGWNGENGTFDWTLTCLDEACTADAALACGETVSGTTIGGSTDITYYGGLGFPFPGTEYIGSFTSAVDATVTVDLTINAAVRLALLILEDDGSGCAPVTFLAGTDQDNVGNGDFTEQVVFDAVAGATYYFVVDSQIPGDEGAVDLMATCVLDCGAQTQCGNECIDTDTNIDNCGACDNICNLANTDTHSCVAGECQVLTCDTDFLDCDAAHASGCEVNRLTDPAHCGDCVTTCSAPTPNCTDGACTDACGANLTDCGGSCVDIQADEAHCGACDNDCNANVQNVSDATCTAGGCGYDACSVGFLDCDADVSNGCEAAEAPTLCGAGCVDCTASVVNVDNIECTAGGCGYDACSVDFLDCDADTVTGCEQAIGDANCGVCGNDCGANASCTASVCECAAAFGNCDGNAGCETALGTVDNCTACDDACGVNSVCDAVDGCGCAQGYADCDDAVGCEIALGTADNCTACDDACVYDHATGACAVAGCELSVCDANFGDCNASDADGCETALNSNTDCGACGTACGPLESCTGDDVNGYSCTDACDDADADGFADANCEPIGGTDCDDSNAAINPAADETCNDVDDDCDGLTDEGFDADGDGYSSCDDDCDDSDADVHPGATEICEDGVDNDCAGGDAECGCLDADLDGFDDAACGGLDCDDNDSNINPDAAESCNQADDNCDGEIDEGDTCEGADGCSCATESGLPSAGGLLALAFILGMALVRGHRD